MCALPSSHEPFEGHHKHAKIKWKADLLQYYYNFYNASLSIPRSRALKHPLLIALEEESRVPDDNDFKDSSSVVGTSFPVLFAFHILVCWLVLRSIRRGNTRLCRSSGRTCTICYTEASLDKNLQHIHAQYSRWAAKKDIEKSNKSM